MRPGFLAALALLALAAPPPDTARIRYFADGDPFRLDSRERIRIAGIHAPEIHADQVKCAAEMALSKAASAHAGTLRDDRDVALSALAAAGTARSPSTILRTAFPKIKIRFVNGTTRGTVMNDREYFKRRAEAERAAAEAAKDATSFRAHMTLAREYEWRAVTEPYPDSGPHGFSREETGGVGGTA